MLANTPETIAALIRHDIPGHKLAKHVCHYSHGTHTYYSLYHAASGETVSGRTVGECIDALNEDRPLPWTVQLNAKLVDQNYPSQKRRD